MTVRLETLGVARVLHHNTVVPLRPTIRDRALAYLAVEGSWVTRDRLGFLFWADAPDATARHNVRQLFKRIRRLDWTAEFEVNGDSVRWPVTTDLDDLSLGDDERAAGVSEGGELLSGLERGASLEFEEWLLHRRRGVDRRWRSVVMAAAREAEDRGLAERALQLLERLLDTDDGTEALPRLMEIAWRIGRGVDGKAAYDQVAERLAHDVGVEMPDEVKELAHRMAIPPPAVAPGGPMPEEIVGRDTDVAELTEMLARSECRLLTLFGPGGIGKSALARRLRDELSGRCDDGVRLISLETVTDARDVASVMLAELAPGRDSGPEPGRVLVQVLRRRRRLVILDNVEHLPDSWVWFAHLTRECADLRLVVTSRERLRLDQEWVYAVGRLDDVDAVRLLEQRVLRIAPDVSIPPEDGLAVCRAVGGSPLGIELAAPWFRVMSPRAVVEQLAGGHDMLDGGRRDGERRHRSVDVAMEHSWRLATLPQREAVEALSVFTAPFTRELARSVASVTPVMLLDLMDKSLVGRTPDDRYASHPLVRTYAARRLAVDRERHRAVRQRYSRHVLATIDGPDHVRAPSIDDAVAAWTVAIDECETDLLCRSAQGVTDLLISAGRLERGLDLLTVAMPCFESAVPSLLYGRARLLYQLGHHHEAADAAAAALAAVDVERDPRLLVKSSLLLGWSRKWLEGDAAQYETVRSALSTAQRLGDAALIAEVLNGLGCSAPTLERCREHLEEGLRHADTAGRELRTVLLQNLGMVMWALGSGAVAVEHLQASVALAREGGGPHRVADGLIALAFVLGELGDYEQALALLAQADNTEGTEEMLDLRIYRLLVGAEIERHLGRRERARTAATKALRMSESSKNDPFALRALRILAILTLDQGETQMGLGLLAFVVSRTGARGGDFTAEIINPKLWRETVDGLDRTTVEAAELWAGDRDLYGVSSAF